MPGSYRAVFLALSDTGAIPRELVERLAAASGFRSLVAHRYGVLDPDRVYRIASRDLDDLLDFCAVLAARTVASNSRRLPRPRRRAARARLAL